MSDAVIFISLENFFAQAECLLHPEIRRRPVAVAEYIDGKLYIVDSNKKAMAAGICPEDRIRVSEAERRGVCIAKFDAENYKEFSRKIKRIASEYSDQIEPFGLDGLWIDAEKLCGSGMRAADVGRELTDRILNETGIAAKAGVSFNKIFAKLAVHLAYGSSVGEITQEDFRNIAWSMPAKMLTEGDAAAVRAMEHENIYRIEDIASCADEKGFRIFGNRWSDIREALNGRESSPVRFIEDAGDIVSFSSTAAAERLMMTCAEAEKKVKAMCESISMRIVAAGYSCSRVKVFLRSKDYIDFRDTAVLVNTGSDAEALTAAAMYVIKNNYNWENAIRSIGVRAEGLVKVSPCKVISFAEEKKKRSSAARRAFNGTARGARG